MLALIVGAMTVATLACLAARTARHRTPHGASAVRWLPSPYRSPVPAASVTLPREELSTTARVAAWASLGQCCVVAPALAFALDRLRLDAYTPIDVVWLALAMGHGWGGCMLLSDPARAWRDVRSLAQASLALGVPVLLLDTVHYVGSGLAGHDPCASSLPVRLAFASLTVVHAAWLLAAVRASSRS
jgi:hypothetical protein